MMNNLQYQKLSARSIPKIDCGTVQLKNFLPILKRKNFLIQFSQQIKRGPIITGHRQRSSESNGNTGIRQRSNSKQEKLACKVMAIIF